MTTPKLSRTLAVGIVVLVLADWLSKFWVANRMALGENLALVDGWIYFVHRKNPGVAFSMLADLPDPWRVPLLSLASLIGVLLFARIVASTTDLLARAGGGMVMAGALANLGDRLVNGHVTDFVVMRYFPFVFNVADAVITLGAVLLASRLVLADVHPASAAAADAG